MFSVVDPFVEIDLSHFFNNDGISYAHNCADGGINVWKNTFPAESLPPSLSVVEVAGVPFRFPNKEDGKLNNIRCNGQEIPLPPHLYDWIYILAAAERRSEDSIYLLSSTR